MPSHRLTSWSSIVDSCLVNIRQAPEYAAVSSIGDTTPQYLQPPPIVEIRQVRSRAEDRSSLNNDAEDDNGTLLMHVALIDSTSNNELPCYYPIINNPTTAIQEFATETQPSLSGCLVSPAYKVHAEAEARVRVQTMRPCHVSISPAFKVLPKESYPGPLAPTQLSITLATQGIRQRVYKQPLIRKRRKPLVCHQQLCKDGDDGQTTTDNVLPLLNDYPVIDVDEETVPPRPVHRKIKTRSVASNFGGAAGGGTVARRRYAMSTPASRVLQQPQSSKSSQFKLHSKPVQEGAGNHVHPSSSRLTRPLGITSNHSRQRTPRMLLTHEKNKMPNDSHLSTTRNDSQRRQGGPQVDLTITGSSGDGEGGSDSSYSSARASPCVTALVPASNRHKDDGDTINTSDSPQDTDDDENGGGGGGLSLSVTIRPRNDETLKGAVNHREISMVRKSDMSPPLVQGSGGKMSLCNLLL
ncbi:hypothetical protein QFC21_005841 [Naganishia friedmannii]|uniref:Uncharacterized protein n=1 Tax=Naganishia friedmannii TaxID=89922 RepID=A0ACC2V684_9TREE|nr:hypothetical protein QFC21_005841 [Naganishia friedmannii]